jgi:hypothetical protein
MINVSKSSEVKLRYVGSLTSTEFVCVEWEPVPQFSQRTFQSVQSQELLAGISVIVNAQPRERQEKLT